MALIPHIPRNRVEKIIKISDEMGRLSKKLTMAVQNGEIPSEEDKKRLKELEEELTRLSPPTRPRRPHEPPQANPQEL